MNRIYADTIHPICIFIFFVGTIGFTLSCFHPVTVVISILSACLYIIRLKGLRHLGGWLKFAVPLFLIIAVGNPLFNHRGVTLLFMLFDQWFTLEALLYGIVSGAQLASIILWSACYQAVMTSDKFLYLFGKLLPSVSLLITMTLRLLPQLQLQLKQIQTSQQMLDKQPDRLALKMHTAIRHISTLLSWSMENAVEMADSMKARGYGLRRRTNFHLYLFDTRDAVILCFLILIGGVCLLGRSFGHGTMEFYPRMTAVITGESGIVTYLAFALLALSPTMFELMERMRNVRIFQQKGGSAVGSVRI